MCVAAMTLQSVALLTLPINLCFINVFLCKCCLELIKAVLLTHVLLTRVLLTYICKHAWGHLAS